MAYTVGEIIIETLTDLGVQVVFGIPGTHTVPLYKGLQELQPEITTITTRHESGAGYAADGYARATGELAAVSVRGTDPEQPPVPSLDRSQRAHRHDPCSSLHRRWSRESASPTPSLRWRPPWPTRSPCSSSRRTSRPIGPPARPASSRTSCPRRMVSR